jgi:hypothetical protein
MLPFTRVQIAVRNYYPRLTPGLHFALWLGDNYSPVIFRIWVTPQILTYHMLSISVLMLDCLYMLLIADSDHVKGLDIIEMTFCNQSPVNHKQKKSNGICK